MLLNKRTIHAKSYYNFINPVTFFPTLLNIVPTSIIKYNMVCNVEMKELMKTLNDQIFLVMKYSFTTKCLI